MTRFAFAFVTLLAFGCASAPTPRYAYDTSGPHRFELSTAPAPAPLADAADPGIALADVADPGIALAPADSADLLALQRQPGSQPPPPPAPQRPPWRSFFSVKSGYYSLEDTDKLDDGFIINLSWTQVMTQNFFSEIELGYLEADGKDLGSKTDLWGIPFMVNARANIPAGPLDLYGGLGFGTIYYEVSSKGGLSTVNADGFAAAGDAFFGGAIHIGDTTAIGLEGKYYVTDSVSGLGGGLDAFAGMLTLSFAR